MPSTPWCRTTKPIASRNGSQSWYSVRMPTITKKWKCISITPPLSPTSTAEDDTSPTAVIADTNLRRPRVGARQDTRTRQ